MKQVIDCRPGPGPGFRLVLWSFILALAACDGGASSTGATCGGFAGVQCPNDEFCSFSSPECGAGDGAGVCQARPDGCDDNYAPVCGCDGMIYSNECNAQQAGVDITTADKCTPPTGTFACGTTYCDKAGTYCAVLVSDVAGVPDDHACRALPAGCGGAATCSCLAGEACGDRCSGTLADGFTLTCPGG